jgi:HemY protein
MIRAFILFIVLVLFSIAVAWMADHPGHVSAVWLGYRIDTSFAVLAGALVLFSVVSGILWRGWGALRSAVRRTGSARAERRRHRGYKALTRGFVAVAAGDPEEARKQAARADGLLADPPLTRLLSAQAAQMAGDQEAARKYFTAMLERPDTVFLGLRGLLNQALRDHDNETALALAKRAYRLRPKTPWLIGVLTELQTQGGLWAEAAMVLHQAGRSRVIAPATARVREAVALYGQSQAAESDGRTAEAADLLRRAYKLAPDLVPVAAKLGRLLAGRGERRRARKIVESAWAEHPHPDLADAFRALAPDEEPLARLQRTARLGAIRPDHEETHIAIAQAALDSRLWGEARRHLRLALLAPNPGRRVFRLMAKLEEQESGDPLQARQWLARAAEAEHEDAWVCRRCAAAVATWHPICPACNAFDGLAWASPARPEITNLPSLAAPLSPLSPPLSGPM